jgi:hypothetical protein
MLVLVIVIIIFFLVAVFEVELSKKSIFSFRRNVVTTRVYLIFA